MAETEERPTDRELLERIEARLARLEEPGGAGGGWREDIPPEAFERRMNRFVIGMNLVTAGLTAAAYWYAPALFAVAFGLFFVFLILAVGLAIDEYVLPTDTFRRISTHALAVAVFWAAVVYLAVSGVRIGTSLLTDPLGGEEGRRGAARVERAGPRGGSGAAAPAPGGGSAAAPAEAPPPRGEGPPEPDGP